MMGRRREGRAILLPITFFGHASHVIQTGEETVNATRRFTPFCPKNLVLTNFNRHRSNLKCYCMKRTNKNTVWIHRRTRKYEKQFIQSSHQKQKLILGIYYHYHLNLNTKCLYFYLFDNPNLLLSFFFIFFDYSIILPFQVQYEALR